VFDSGAFERLQAWLLRTDVVIFDKALWAISNLLVTSDKHAYHLWQTSKIFQRVLELTKMGKVVATEAIYVVTFTLTTLKPAQLIWIWQESGL